MTALIVSIVAIVLSLTSLGLLVARNKRMFGRYFPPGPPKGWKP